MKGVAMAVTLPDDKNPYTGRTPFDTLGVSPSASEVELRDARDEKLEEIDDEHFDDNEKRLALSNEVKQAYESVRSPEARMTVEMFFYDPSVGQEGCQQEAQNHQTLSFDFNRVLERVEDIIPDSPSVKAARKHFRPVHLEQSVLLATDVKEFAADPRQEALSSIVFER